MSAPVAELVTAQDVVDATAGELPAADTAERVQLDVLCTRAAAEIRAHVVAVDRRIAAGSLDLDRVRGIAVDMVVAALETLEIGFRSTGETYPEIGTQHVAAANRMSIEMTPAQMRALAPPAPGMYSVSLSG
ncbi:hypothetical protein [Gordonia malaquae]|uniref:hypothetical protein n=1 Tax=Gordonia malaquae TaxID=410332 RepID=UPI0030198642